MWKLPIERLSPGNMRLCFLGGLVATFCLGALMTVGGGPLRTARAPQGIVSFQLTGSPEKMARLMEEWGGAGRAQALNNSELDLLFIPAYVLSLLAFVVLMGGTPSGQRIFGWGVIGAGLLDYCETLLGIRILTGAELYYGWTPAMTACATGKYTLILAALIYAITQGVRSAFYKVRAN
jgi:hypothetical protein